MTNKFKLVKKPSLIFIVIILAALLLLAFYYLKSEDLTNQIKILISNEEKIKSKLQKIEKELNDLKNQDQYKINKELQEEVKNIQNTYKQAVSTYEKILDLRDKGQKLAKLEEDFVKSLKFLADRKYATASSTLADINKKIKEEEEKLASSFKIPENIPTIPQGAPKAEALPSSGYRRQAVKLDIGTYMVDIISADLSSTRVIVDTASDGDCSNDCPVLSLADYVSRNGAIAGVNGSYFCPAAYPSCVGKTNSFDTLLMNKNKVYFNSANNVYSTVPATIFSGNSVRYVGQSLEWGRDTSVDAVLANYPLLVLNNQVVFGGNSDPKQGSKGARSFVGNTGTTIYIGVVHNATVAESARVLQAIGIQNALNLDNGGSTALWFGGYKVGPGRNLPNVLLLVKK